METLNITFEDGNVAIDSNCSQESFMEAVKVMTASLVLGSTNEIDELFDIIKTDVMFILENNNLQEIKKDEE